MLLGLCLIDYWPPHTWWSAQGLYTSPRGRAKVYYVRGMGGVAVVIA